MQFCLAPAPEPTILFAQSSKEIIKIIVPSERNSSHSETRSVAGPQVLKLSAPIAMEANFLNHTLCVLESLKINCYNVSDLNQKWQLPMPDIFPENNCKLMNFPKIIKLLKLLILFHSSFQLSSNFSIQFGLGIAKLVFHGLYQ